MTYSVARLLRKDLGKFYHIGRVELLGKIHHNVRIVLLVAWTGTSEKGAKGVDSYLIALLATIRGILTILMAKD
jgi:hypothetical protein